MPLVTTKDMFKKAYEGHYAVGAFNVNNMEIVQGIVDAAKEEESPLILQVSAGARKYAKHAYLLHLFQASLEDTDLRLAMTASIRKYLAEHPEDFDPRSYLGAGRQAIKDMVSHKMRDVLNSSHRL